MGDVSSSIKNEKIQIKLDKMSKNGDIKNAIEFCRSAIKSDPTNPELHIRLGDLYLEWHLDIYQIKQYLDEAITEYQRALEASCNSGLIHYKIALALYYKGDLDKSVHHLNIAMDYDNKMANANLLMAKILSKKDRFLEAIACTKKAIKFGGLKSSRAHYMLHSLLKIKPGNDFSSRLRSEAELWLSFLTLPFDKDALKEVISNFNYIKFFPAIFHGYFLEKTKSLYKAIDLYEEAIEHAPGFLPFYILLGDIYRSIGKFEEAVNEYRMALWIDPLNMTAYRVLCQAYEEQGDYDNAIKMYKKLIEIYPTDAVLHSNLANILYLKGETKEAITCYHTAITLNPNDLWTSVIAQTLGYVFQEAKENYDAAICAYQSASLLNPKDIDVYISLGSAFYDKKDYDNALSVYRSALEIEPRNAKIHCNIGYLLWGKGLIEESLKEYQLSIKYDPTYDIAYNNMGVIYLDDLGKLNEAVKYFEKAISNNPNYALAYYNLGRTLALKNDKIEAARLFQVALDLNAVTNEMDGSEIKEKINELFD